MPDEGRTLTQPGTPEDVCTNCKGSGMDATSHFDDQPAEPHACGYCQGGTYSGKPAASGRTPSPVEDWIKALNAASCCGTPDPNAKTLREWEAEANARRYPPLPLRTRVGIRVAEAISCPACFRLRLSPGHLLFCGGSL